MSDELVYSKDSIAAEVANFAKGLDFTQESAIAEKELASDALPDYSSIHDDIDFESTWETKDESQENPLVSKQDIPADKPSQTIKFKANGKDMELSVEEAQRRLSLAEGARQALQDRAKLRKENETIRKQAEELTKYKETWDKLESVKHDRRQLLELITGESYDDLIAQEAEKREIHLYGTDEQKQLLEYSEKVQRLEREKELENGRREKAAQQVDKANYDAEQTRLKTAMEKEFGKYKLPEGLDPTAQTKLSKMLWKQSVDDLKSYHSQYGKITGKMVEKAFQDNANILLNSHKEQVDKKVAEIRQTEKSTAKEQAQLASLKNSDDQGLSQLSRLNPNQLFDLFRKGR